METRPIFVLLGLLAAGGAFAEAYTWTDEDGVVHYSDRPQPGAKVIDLGDTNSRRPRPANRSTNADDADDADNQASDFAYNTIEIASPSAEETLWNIEGTLGVTLALSPALKPGHQVRVYFDGTPRMVSGTSFQLQDVYRGMHNLQAEVIDETGKLLIRSLPSRFYVQQNSVL